MAFTRHAIYFVPPAGTAWAEFATRWLGWNAETSQVVPHPDPVELGGIDCAAITETPRKYGLHATMKPPFRLHPQYRFDDLRNACSKMAFGLSPVALDGFEIARLGRFLALQPAAHTPALDALAATCVQDLDRFRAPSTEAELARRRKATLTPTQQVNLTKWGYPFVMDSFRFHITLTGRLAKAELARVQDVLDMRLAPLLPTQFSIADLALMGEAEDGRFHLLHRYALSG